jgi:ABC-type transporter Mla MlaB component
MLKITRVASTTDEITLRLDGSVAGPWIELLAKSAESVLEEGRRLILDLENICFIDCEGLALIKSLIGRGVRQINAPLFVGEQIEKCEEARGDSI